MTDVGKIYQKMTLTFHVDVWTVKEKSSVRIVKLWFNMVWNLGNAKRQATCIHRLNFLIHILRNLRTCHLSDDEVLKALSKSTPPSLQLGYINNISRWYSKTLCQALKLILADVCANKWVYHLGNSQTANQTATLSLTRSLVPGIGNFPLSYQSERSSNVRGYCHSLLMLPIAWR